MRWSSVLIFLVACVVALCVLTVGAIHVPAGASQGMRRNEEARSTELFVKSCGLCECVQEASRSVSAVRANPAITCDLAIRMGRDCALLVSRLETFNK